MPSMRFSRTGWRIALLPILTAAVVGSGVRTAAASGEIAGAVTDAATAAPLAGVQVTVFNASGSSVGYALTNGAGQYTLSTGLPTGSYYAKSSNTLGYLDEVYDNVSCPVYCTIASGTPIAVTDGARTSGINFALAKGGRIAGIVKDAATGARLAGVGVWVSTPDGYSFGTTTDATGAYLTGPGLASGTYRARTTNNLGYVEQLYKDMTCLRGSCSVSSGTPITVTAGATTGGVDFALAKGGRVSGSVKDATTGAALSGVCVRVYRASGSSYDAEACTDSSGLYATLTGLPTGTYYALTYDYSNRGYLNQLYNNVACPFNCSVSSGTPITVTAGGTMGGVNFSLTKGGQISGIVTDAATGLPLPDYFKVNFYDSSGNYVPEAYSYGASGYTTRAFPAGTYYALTASGASLGYTDELYDNISCPNQRCTVTSGTPITVRLGAITSGINFALLAADRGPDWNGDGQTDLLWHNQATGELYAWLLQGKIASTGSYLTPSRQPDTRWQIRALADFNSDGKVDILWHHQVSGDLYVWFMNGTSVASASYLTPRSFADTRWQIRGMRDFDSDGKVDILWHHQVTGDLYVWFMNGTSVVGGSYLTPRSFADTRWQIRNVTDLDRDGRADILWHNQVTGELYVWFLSGLTVARGSYLTPSRQPDTNWVLVQVADFNQDGWRDILWHHQVTGELYVWFMNGTSVASGSYMSPSRFSDTNWKVVPR